MTQATACLDITPTLPTTVIVIVIVLSRIKWKMTGRFSAGSS